MKSTSAISFFLSVISAFCLAEDLPKFDKLTLKNGHEYEKVKVTSKNPDGITIMHDAGLARIKYEQLPDAIVAQLGGFDPDAAAKARAAADAKESATQAELNRLEKINGDEKLRSDTAKKRETDAKPAIVRIIQSSGSGSVCDVAWFTTDTTEDRRKDALGRTVTTARTERVLGSQQPHPIFILGLSADDGICLGVKLTAQKTRHQVTYENGERGSINSYVLEGKAVASTVGPTRASTYRRPTTYLQSVGGG